MNDIRQQLSVRYTTSDREHQVLFLAKLADRLTLLGRDTYDSQYGVLDSVRLRAFNEAQNRILAQLVRMLTKNEQRYPDDVFANILVDQFDILKLDPETILEFLD
jgi:hypothetical protein